MPRRKLASPSFRLDEKTSEVCIPYDQFHTFMVDAISLVEELEAEIKALGTSDEIKINEGQPQASGDVQTTHP